MQARQTSRFYIEHAASLDAMGERLTAIATELAEQDFVVSSVAPMIDREDPEGPYIFVVVGRLVDF
jgi:hypothetical protein